MMKSIVRTIILVAASVFAAISCQKEAAVSEPQNPVNAGETIQVNINASLGDLVAADGTKATAESVVRLKWTSGDVVQAYCGTGKISTDGLTVTPSANGLFASLTGTIDPAPEPSEIITFVYSSGCTVSDDGLTFDFSSQTAEIPFVAYATLVYDGTATLTDKMVEFKFATSVMKVAATNLGGGAISNATISGINTKVKLTPSDGSETCTIEGENKATITKTAGIEASSDGTRAIITVGLVPDNNTGRSITVKQSDYTNKGVITKTTIESSKSYTTPTSLFTRGKIGEHDYVLIAGTKWATHNIDATADTGPDSYGTYFAWGDVNGQEASTKTGSSTIYYAFAPGFSWSNCPFAVGGTYKFNKYVPLDKTDYLASGFSGDDRITLELADDAANKKWGGSWRMPTSAEFQALKDATYWKWEDGGYYVYAPQSGDAGKTSNDSGVTGTYDDVEAALLFFPAAGYGDGTSLGYAGSYGLYWSSSLDTSGPDLASNLTFDSDSVSPQDFNYRYYGFSVRPVSD